MTAAELIALAERVEGLTEADRVVDWLIADAFGEVPKHSIREIGFDYDWYRRPNEYSLWKAKDAEGRSAELWQPKPLTASLDAVVSLIEQVLPDAEWKLVTCFGGGFHAEMWNDAEVREFTSRAEIAACSVLAALLRAKAAEVAG